MEKLTIANMIKNSWGLGESFTIDEILERRMSRDYNSFADFYSMYCLSLEGLESEERKKVFTCYVYVLWYRIRLGVIRSQVFDDFDGLVKVIDDLMKRACKNFKDPETVARLEHYVDFVSERFALRASERPGQHSYQPPRAGDLALRIDRAEPEAARGKVDGRKKKESYEDWSDPEPGVRYGPDIPFFLKSAVQIQQENQRKQGLTDEQRARSLDAINELIYNLNCGGNNGSY